MSHRSVDRRAGRRIRRRVIPTRRCPPGIGVSCSLIMTPLPIDPRIPEIVASLREHQRLVLVAPPGAGKTTRVPTAIVEAGPLDEGHPAPGLPQPPRGAAGGAAGRVPRGNGWGGGGGGGE